MGNHPDLVIIDDVYKPKMVNVPFGTLPALSPEAEFVKNFDHSPAAYQQAMKMFGCNLSANSKFVVAVQELQPDLWPPKLYTPPLPSSYTLWHGLYLPKHVIGILTPKPVAPAYYVKPVAPAYYTPPRGVEAQLVDLFPAIRNYKVNECPASKGAECPCCEVECDKCAATNEYCCGYCYEDSEYCTWYGDTLSHMIQHLNDEHVWSRQQIADWLEKLDVDLTMSATQKGN